MQHRRVELLRAGRAGVAIEQLLGLDHQGPEPLPVPGPQRRRRLVDDPLVDRPQQLLHPLLELVLGERVGPVQVLEDRHRVLLRLQVHDHEVQVRRRPQLLRLQPLPVELHQDRVVAEGAPLVHPPAARGRGDLPLVRQLHLPAHRQPQVVDPVEGPGGQHRDGRARREPLLDGQVGPGVVDHEAAHPVVGEHLVRHPRRVGEEPSLLRLVEQRLRLEGDLLRPDHLPVVGGRGENERVGVRLHLRVDPLVGPRDERVPLLHVGVDAPVAARPVRVLPEETDPPGHEDLHSGGGS